ncbi:alpha-amylase family glycosyl hydrolase [Frigidibacter sp. ROC022]|uniref:alpha-amylase family glycosyl hydrolase n=1 Tax=Frigidibacter sp. ROC022 TaxID=2971796 RepID=UPI00215ACF34|nr:alpha-amylase family glycosyl hydrolase [Frigidibacter sp. ROC022]MCR8723952.1 alpha-amylase family glycosyl hydrolase [Frigidibacter sp. ROC022]
MREWVRDKDWWRGAVIYQVYPRSFQDSNGDGVGDLLGIVQRLPYVASLGVDAVWISPFFTSPMKDFGYDVSDYRDVDPMFGTLSDFDTLIEAAHALGLMVMIDLVLSHSSDAHPWFQQSRVSRDNDKADWYVWADPKPDGTAPNNWLSVFGGPAWAWNPERMQYYLHNFLTAQPDLNFHCPEVQDELLSIARFWLDRGVDGFRLDTINFYIADAQLRDNPALPPEERNDTIAPAVNPYNWQRHIYSKNQPENLEFLKKFRAVCDEYNAAAVGEVGDAQRGLEIMAEYTSGGDKVQMCYPFDLLQPHRPTSEDLAATFRRLEAFDDDFWPCWAYSNHDVVRHISRWDLTPPAARVYTTMLLTLRGSACIYQGEELGLHEADLAYEDLQDPYGIEFWPEFKGRDGCRTPMVWETDNLYGGFSTHRPWLPVPSEHLHHSVQDAEHDPGNILHHYRRALAFRRSHLALRKGTQSRVEAVGDVVQFTRQGPSETIFCAFNLGKDPAETDLPEGRWVQIGTELNSAHADGEGHVRLGPWQCCLALKTKG